jgi:hypothetical protein
VSIRSDYISRLIKQLAEALGAILKARKKNDLVEAQRLIRKTSEELLGIEYETLTRYDAKSVAQLLIQPEKIHALARLLKAEGELLDQEELASMKFNQALALLEASGKPDLQLEAELRALITGPS